MATEVETLGFNKYPKSVDRILNSYGWENPLNRLRMGVVLTFATTVPFHGGAHRFIVDKLETGQRVLLQHPGQLNNGFDYQVRVEGWDRSAAPRPSHDEIYSDFFHKRENDSKNAFEALCKAAMDIHGGEGADVVLERYDDRFDFATGRVPEALLRPLPWLFIEQDIRYWHGDGRDMTVGAIRDLCNGKSEGELGLDVQPLEEINQTELAIESGSKLGDY